MDGMKHLHFNLLIVLFYYVINPAIENPWKLISLIL